MANTNWLSIESGVQLERNPESDSFVIWLTWMDRKNQSFPKDVIKRTEYDWRE